MEDTGEGEVLAVLGWWWRDRILGALLLLWLLLLLILLLLVIRLETLQRAQHRDLDGGRRGWNRKILRWKCDSRVEHHSLYTVFVQSPNMAKPHVLTVLNDDHRLLIVDSANSRN